MLSQPYKFSIGFPKAFMSFQNGQKVPERSPFRPAPAPARERSWQGNEAQAKSATAAFPALLGRHPCCGDRHRSGPMERRRHHDAGGRSPKLARRGRFLAARARQCRGDRAMRRGRAHGRFRSAMHHHRESAGSTGAVGLWGDTSYFGRFSSASTGPAAIATRRAAIRLRSCSGSGRDDSAS